MTNQDENSGTVVAVCRSEVTGQPKSPVDGGILRAGHGLEGDAHAGTWHRQISLLAEADIELMRSKGLTLEPGAFGENLVVRGMDLQELQVGARLMLGGRAELQITQRGKQCHTRCAIYHQAGDCIMPRLGLFARVRRGGTVAPGDPLVLAVGLEAGVEEP